jgi:dienelactone hydrolase
MKRSTVFIGYGVAFLLLCSCISVVGASPVSPDQPGPYPIGSFRVFYLAIPYGVYQATVRYPATADGWRTPADSSAAPYPGIVVANGLLGAEWQITWIAEHLTPYGYITVCFTPPQRLSFDTTQWASGFLAGFKALQRQNDRRFSPIYRLLDTETCGAIGLSMGGGGCVEATGAADSPIDASVALAPAGFSQVLSAAQNIMVPIQLQVGSVDRIIPPDHVLKIYTQYITNETHKEYLAITGGNHIGYIDEYYARLAQRWGIDNPAGISVEQQHMVSRKYFTAWFQYYLRNLDEYYTYLFGENAQQDLDTGVLSDLRYNRPGGRV